MNIWIKLKPDSQTETLKLIKYYNNTILFNSEIYLIQNITSFVPVEIETEDLEIADATIRIYALIKFFLLLISFGLLFYSFNQRDRILFPLFLILFVVILLFPISFHLYGLRLSLNSGSTKLFIIGNKIETSVLTYKIQDLIEENKWKSEREKNSGESMQKPEVIYQAPQQTGNFGVGYLLINIINNFIGKGWNALNDIGEQTVGSFWGFAYIFAYINIQEFLCVYVFYKISDFINKFVLDYSLYDLAVCFQDDTDFFRKRICLSIIILNFSFAILFLSQMLGIFLFILTPQKERKNKKKALLMSLV
jgi:hypothetical protein